ncbi:MAG: hypothetical protein ACWGOX_15745 [Desulforhopalus sp.]
MYLAKLQCGPHTRYQIRQSYRTDENCLLYRILFDLGADPGQFFKVLNDHIVLFDDDLLAAVSPYTDGDCEDELEDLLLTFLPPETTRRRMLFRRYHDFHKGPLTSRDKKDIAEQVHLFDRRRLYYLRYGAVDQSRLWRLHEKCCRPLVGQSRDEREYYFRAEEAVLRPGSYMQYVYAIFDLQKHFHQSFAPWLPEALAREEIDAHFLSELCRLHDDTTFWQGVSSGNSLHHHLVRYLIMFFDYSPAIPSFQHDFARRFMAGHRRFRWPDKVAAKGPEQISAIFQTPYQKLKAMSRKELSKLYRHKAMELHPDKGGDHDLFIQLTEVYTQLIQNK